MKFIKNLSISLASGLLLAVLFISLQSTTGRDPLIKSAWADGVVNQNVSSYTTGIFGDSVSVPLTPIINGSFIHGLNNQIVTAGTPLNSATADTNAGRARLQTGTNSAGAAAIVSKKPMRYREGEGILLRYTAAFTTCVANSTQLVGAANYTSSASNTDFVDSVLTGCNGANFGILYRNNSSDTFIAQSSFNIDKINGTGKSGFTIDYTKGNIYQVQYPFLGYGDILISVQNPDTGLLIPVHRVKYSNTSTNIEFSNPNLSFYALVKNSGNTTNLTTYIGSFAGFITGERKFLGANFGFSNRKQNITTRTNVFTMKMATTLNGAAVKGITRLKSCSFACDAGNDTCHFELVKDTTLGGTPSYTPISGSTADNGVTLTSANSAISTDTAGTTLTGGTVQFNSAASRNTGYTIDLTPYDLFIAPGETYTAAITGDSALVGRVACNWSEDY